MVRRAEINGFSISSLKTMQGLEGWITRCNILFKGKKIGSYFNDGNGGAYNFYPESSYSSEKIERVISTFPRIERDFGYDLPLVDWDMGILVEELVEKGKTLAQYRLAEKQGRHLVEGIDWKRDIAIRINMDPTLSDWEAETILMQSFKRSNGTISEWHRYTCCEDINDSNTEVDESMLLK